MFENEIKAKCKINEFGFGFSIWCESAKIIHVAGHKKVLHFSNESIILVAPKTDISISGNNLTIIELQKKELIIEGDIHSIQFGGKTK